MGSRVFPAPKIQDRRRFVATIAGPAGAGLPITGVSERSAAGRGPEGGISARVLQMDFSCAHRLVFAVWGTMLDDRSG